MQPRCKIDWRKRNKVYAAIERATLTRHGAAQTEADQDLAAFRSRTLSPEKFCAYLIEEEDHRSMAEHGT